MRTLRDTVKNIARKTENFLLNRRAYDCILTGENGKGSLYLGAAPGNSTFQRQELADFFKIQFGGLITALTDAEISDYEEKHERLRRNLGNDGNYIQIEIPDHKPLDFNEEEKIQKIFSCIKAVQDILNSEKNVYIHCRQGIGRSASLAILIYTIEKSLHQNVAFSIFKSLEEIKKIRPQVAPNEAQIRSVCVLNIKYHKNLFEENPDDDLALKKLVTAYSDLTYEISLECIDLLQTGNKYGLLEFIENFEKTGLLEYARYILSEIEKRRETEKSIIEILHTSLLRISQVLIYLSGFIEILPSITLSTPKNLPSLLTKIEEYNNFLSASTDNPAIAQYESKLLVASFQDIFKDPPEKTITKRPEKIQQANIAASEKLNSISHNLSLNIIDETEANILKDLSAVKPEPALSLGQKLLEILKKILGIISDIEKYKVGIEEKIKEASSKSIYFNSKNLNNFFVYKKEKEPHLLADESTHAPSR